MKGKKNVKNVNQKEGISLIVLVITIIVIVILAVAVILSIADNNPISNANKASFQNDVKSMQEELELIKASNYAESQGKDYGTISFDSLTGKDKYKEKFDIKNGELVYTSKLKGDELIWAKELGIASSAFVLDESVEGVTIKDGVFKTTWNRFDDDVGDYVTKLTDRIEEIVEIPDGVNRIEGLAFYQGSGGDEIKITTVILPDTVKEIGYQAFWYCGKLKEINFPNGLEKIEMGAFNNCVSLERVELPDSVKTIGDNAFYNCKALKEVRMSNSIESIGYMAFEGCTNVTDIIIPDGIKNIEFVYSFDNWFNLTLTISEETAKRLYPDITSEADLADKLGVASVVFK